MVIFYMRMAGVSFHDTQEWEKNNLAAALHENRPEHQVEGNDSF